MNDELFKGMEEIRIQYLENILESTQRFYKLFTEKQPVDPADIRTFAHQINGSGSSYGFDFITEAGKSLSENYKKQDIDKVIAILGDLIKQIPLAKEKIERS